MYDWIMECAKRHLSDAIEFHRNRKSSADMRFPHNWFIEARKMRRRIIFHAGPTNSGAFIPPTIKMRLFLHAHYQKRTARSMSTPMQATQGCMSAGG